MTRWIVTFSDLGDLVRVFYTEYHAEQFTRALTLNGTPWSLSVEGPFGVTSARKGGAR